MLVSQYIFTACGKQKHGDFVVWSKSPDITDAEGEEIHQLMVYKNPVGVNLYEATEEQIRAACPTRYAYFMLSTGKKVLAESNFIGRVYSDMDKRWGNFFIHAYVFDSLGDAFPMSLLCKGKFKDKLEYGEWHDSPCPDSLPQIEVQPEAVNIREVEAFLTPERKTILPHLLQAVINAVKGGTVVSFNDTEENQKMWYTVLGMLLSPEQRENATFASQVVPVFTSPMQMGGMTSAKPLIMRNVSDSTPLSVFNYTTAAAANQPAFDFRKNITVSLQLDSYVTELGNALNKSLISALEYMKDIENLCRAYACGQEQAVALYMLKNSRLQWFGGFDAYVSTVNEAVKCGMITAETAANLVFNAVFVNRQWQPDVLPLPILKQIYANGAQNVKDEMIAYYKSHLSGYGVNSSDAAAYVGSFYASAPFTTAEYLKYLAAKKLFEAGFVKNNGFRDNYLIYHTFLSEYKNLNADVAYPVVSEVFANYAAPSTYAELDLLLSKAYAVGANLAEGMVRDLVGGITDPAGSTDLLFHLTEVVKSSALQLDLFRKAVEANMYNANFIVTYTGYFNRNSALYSSLERELVRDPKFAHIQISRETYPFRVNNNVTRADLNAYFKKYYLNGYDDGLYLDKLKTYLKTKREVKYCFEVYSDIRTIDIGYADMKDIFAYIRDVMYQPPVDEIIKYPRQDEQLLYELDSLLAAAGAEPDGKSAYVRFTRRLLAAERDGNVSSQIIGELGNGQDIYAGLSEAQVDDTVNKYLCNLFELYTGFRAAQNAKGKIVDNAVTDGNVNVLSNLLFRPLRSRYFSGEFIRACAKLNSKNSLTLLTDMFVLACAYNSNVSDRLKVVLKKYLDNFSSRRKADGFVEDVLKNAPEFSRQSITEFAGSKMAAGKEPDPFEDFRQGKEKGGDNCKEKKEKEKKSGGFFSQIFGFGKKKKDDSDDEN